MDLKVCWLNCLTWGDKWSNSAYTVTFIGFAVVDFFLGFGFKVDTRLFIICLHFFFTNKQNDKNTRKKKTIYHKQTNLETKLLLISGRSNVFKYCLTHKGMWPWVLKSLLPWNGFFSAPNLWSTAITNTNKQNCVWLNWIIKKQTNIHNNTYRHCILK